MRTVVVTEVMDVFIDSESFCCSSRFKFTHKPSSAGRLIHIAAVMIFSVQKVLSIFFKSHCYFDTVNRPQE